MIKQSNSKVVEANQEKIEFKISYCKNSDVYIIKPKLKRIKFGVSDLLTCGTDMSCGVCQLYGISYLESIIKESLKYRSKNEVLTMLEQTLNKCIEIIKKEKRIAFIIASNSHNYPMVNSILKRIAVKTTGYKINPNTGNKICVFVL